MNKNNEYCAGCGYEHKESACPKKYGVSAVLVKVFEAHWVCPNCDESYTDHFHGKQSDIQGSEVVCSKCKNIYQIIKTLTKY